MLRISAFAWVRKYGCWIIATWADRGSLVINNWQRVEFSTDNIIKEKYECVHPSELPASIEYLMYTTMMMPIPVPLAPGGYVSEVYGNVQITPLKGNIRWVFPGTRLERNEYTSFVDIYLSEGRVLEAYEYYYISSEKKGVNTQAMALII